MLGLKKFLIIPALIALYFILINVLVSTNISVGSAPSSGESSSGGLVIGIGQGVSVSVTRAYLFGLIRLPVYSSSLGDIGIIHDLFFYFIIALTGILVFTEVFKKKELHEYGYGKKFNYKTRQEENKMKMSKFQFGWKKILKSVTLGLAVGLVSFILSADGGPSVALGLLIIYLEYKFR